MSKSKTPSLTCQTIEFLLWDAVSLISCYSSLFAGWCAFPFCVGVKRGVTGGLFWSWRLVKWWASSLCGWWGGVGSWCTCHGGVSVLLDVYIVASFQKIMVKSSNICWILRFGRGFWRVFEQSVRVEFIFSIYVHITFQLLYSKSFKSGSWINIPRIW